MLCISIISKLHQYTYKELPTTNRYQHARRITRMVKMIN